MTKTEIKILQTLWKNDTPMCAAQILEQNSDMKEITVRVTIRNMLESGLIRVAGRTRRTKTFAKTYTPNVTREQVIQESVQVEPFSFTAAFLRDGMLSREQLRALREIIEQREKEL